MLFHNQADLGRSILPNISVFIQEPQHERDITHAMLCSGEPISDGPSDCKDTVLSTLKRIVDGNPNDAEYAYVVRKTGPDGERKDLFGKPFRLC